LCSLSRDRLQYLFFIDLATILTHCHVLKVTRPLVIVFNTFEMYN